MKHQSLSLFYFKKVAITLLLSFIATTLFAKENLSKEKRAVGSFQCVQVAGTGHLYLKQGNQPALTIEAPAHLLSQVTSQVKGNCLSLSIKGQNQDLPIHYYLTVTELTEVKTSGGIHIHSQGTLTGNTLILALTGTGNTDLKIKHNLFKSQITGAGNLKVEGRTQEQVIEIIGSGQFEGKKLTSEKSRLSIRGSGIATVHALQELDANIAGSGLVRYYGNPKIHQQVSGSGEIIPL